MPEKSDEKSETRPAAKKKSSAGPKGAVPKGAVAMFGGVDLFGGKNPFAHRR